METALVKRFLFLCLFGSVLLGFVTSAQAFNGERKGFVFGGGMGVGSAHTSRNNDADFAGLSLDAKLGYGLSHKFIVYLSAKTLLVNDTMDKYFISNPAASASYYFSDFGSSFYLSGGLGLRVISAQRWLGGSGDFTGPSGFLGAGYELGPGFSIEGFIIYSDITDADFTVTSTGLTLNFLGY